jgi:hypothetical protein
VRVQAERHFQLIDWFRREPLDEAFVQSTESPVVTLESRDAVIDGKTDAHRILHRCDTRNGRQVVQRTVGVGFHGRMG